VNASWDDRLLAQQLKDLSLLGLDFGFDSVSRHCWPPAERNL
jgi:hypothetical protein